MSITRINEFHAAPGSEAALGDFLKSIIAQIEGAPGCRRVTLYVDPADPSRHAIIEEWDSVESHQAAATRIPQEQMAAFMPLIAEPPRGRYYTQVRPA